MIKIEPDMQQLILTKEESSKLRNEFEDMFCIADHGRKGNCYSLEWVTKHFPTVAEFYKTACLGR